MRRIYKWPLDLNIGVTTLPWSPGDRVLLVGESVGTLMLWAEQQDAHHVPRRKFTVVGTGFEAPAGLVHVGSAVCGMFVWHVYTEPIELPTPPLPRTVLFDAGGAS